MEKPGKPDLIPDWKVFYRMPGRTPQGHKGHTKQTHTHKHTHTHHRETEKPSQDRRNWGDVTIKSGMISWLYVQQKTGANGRKQWNLNAVTSPARHKVPTPVPGF